MTGGTMQVFIPAAFIFCLCWSSVLSMAKPKNITEEMYCLGCEVTVKELDFILKRKPTRGMGETVTRALAKVCDLNNFKKYDFDAKKVLDVCKHIKGNKDMEAVLIDEYGRKHAQGKDTTYLDITHMVCANTIKACKDKKYLESSKDEDGSITFDPETEDFEIKYGKKVRTPRPVTDAEAPGPNETLDTLPMEQSSGSEPEGTQPTPSHATSTQQKEDNTQSQHTHEHQEL